MEENKSQNFEATIYSAPIRLHSNMEEVSIFSELEISVHNVDPNYFYK